MALALAARRAGHELCGVIARRATAAEAAARRLDTRAVPAGAPIPACDLLLVAVRDDAIAATAAELAPRAAAVVAAVHLSGATSVASLEPLACRGVAVGAFHPLQTLPTPEAGAERLAGAGVGITASGPLRDRLFDLARSLGAVPFSVADERKPCYHAAAAAAANFPLVAFAMAEDLFTAAGVPFAAARPLVEAAVANAFELGVRASLTGPVARGDVETVRHQLAAVAAAAPEWEPTFRGLVGVLARLAGREEAFREVTG